MIFDSHAHIISADHERYPVTPLSGKLQPGDLDDPVTAERLLKLMDENGVQRALLVQRAHIYGFNNDYVVDSAARHPDRFRALCMVDALDPRVREQIRHWVRERGAIGIRLTEPHKGADPSWFASPQAQAAWETAAELGISVRLHLYRWNRLACLPAIPPLLKSYPQTSVVIDHLSNLAAEEGAPDYGLDPPLRALLPFSNLYLLYSAINLANLAAKSLPSAPVLARLVQEFGAHRIMWGSDIAQSKGSYAHLRELGEAATAMLGAADRQRVLHDTGAAVYWNQLQTFA